MFYSVTTGSSCTAYMIKPSDVTLKEGYILEKVNTAFLRVTAEKLGFKYNNHYYSFTSYPPIKNLKELSESEWHEWGAYLEYAAKTEECFRHEWVCTF
ncbi:hypothetical protein [Clostridium tagluense]|uniref:hypothetical protein n=1 Tax=Clostridium tagluense TaxID=360422 RepID=UPI001C0DD000|nr:hypothetical protein [Clostridium tagluense]MBU3130408.1 hypothetical protein [Clostridium tagluense]